MPKILLVLLVVLLLSLPAAAQANKFVGAWKLVEVKITGEKPETITSFQPNLHIYTKKHYSVMVVRAKEPRPVPADNSKLSAEELLKIYVNDFVANSGTYEVKGDKITVRPIVAKSPGFMQPGNFVTSVFKIEGNYLTMTQEADKDGPVKNPTTVKLERIE
jgi:hypothetical protein